jgi:hypothetical protein
MFLRPEMTKIAAAGVKTTCAGLIDYLKSRPQGSAVPSRLVFDLAETHCLRMNWRRAAALAGFIVFN